MDDKMIQLGTLLADIMIYSPNFEQRLGAMMQQAVLENLRNNMEVREEIQTIVEDTVDEPFSGSRFRDAVRDVVRDMDFSVEVH